MSDESKAFNELAGELDCPMFIVTVAAAGEREGCLVGFATQASIDPPRFLVCMSKNNRTLLLDPFAAHKGHGDGAFRFHRAKRVEPGPEA